MEKWLNSSSESTVTDNPEKAAFNKPADFYQAFEVSMEESIGVSQSNKSDLALDTTSSGATKVQPFRKSRKSIQHSFNISSGESLVNNESEESVTIARPQGLFAKQNKSLVEFFNVSFNETNLADAEESKTKETPENNNANAVNSDINDTTEVTIFETKSNPFKQRRSENEYSMMSLTEQRNARSTDSYGLLSDPNQTSGNISINKSTSKLTNNTSYLEQSSINDDNLNNWMSDQSEEEMPPPRIPSLTANLSGTKEKQVPSNSPVEESNPISLWEQKFNEMVTNAEKKSQALKSKVTLESPKKESTSKKIKVNKENPDCPNENIEVKYKPPKLLRPASFVSKQLYGFIKKKLEPKYGIDVVIESENLVSLICDTVKKVTRRKTYQKRLIQKLKKEMAEAGVIETTMDFYEFIIKFLPYNFRVKVVPCLQPVTNMVYPPKDIANPFDKIL